VVARVLIKSVGFPAISLAVPIAPYTINLSRRKSSAPVGSKSTPA